jgi:hypothetical protein
MLRRLLLIPLALVAGCNGGLTVTPFIGSIMQMTFSANVGVTAPGTHLELWTRNANNDIIRLDASYTFIDPADKTKSKTVFTQGLAIRPSVTIDDPCMIDGHGNLLITPAAYQTRMVDTITETPEEQAQSTLNRIAQVTSTNQGGKAPATLLAVVPYDTTQPPVFAPSPSPQPTAAERLAACQQYWAASPLAYTASPFQYTAPIHGVAYGFVSFTTTEPVAAYDGIRIDTPTNLAGTQELWLSVETAALDKVDPENIGPTFLQGKQAPGGNDVLFFDLVGPMSSGTAAIYVNLDDDSVTF